MSFNFVLISRLLRKTIQVTSHPSPWRVKIICDQNLFQCRKTQKEKSIICHPNRFKENNNSQTKYFSFILSSCARLRRFVSPTKKIIISSLAIDMKNRDLKAPTSNKLWKFSYLWWRVSFAIPSTREVIEISKNSFQNVESFLFLRSHKHWLHFTASYRY